MTNKKKIISLAITFLMVCSSGLGALAAEPTANLTDAGKQTTAVSTENSKQQSSAGDAAATNKTSATSKTEVNESSTTSSVKQQTGTTASGNTSTTSGSNTSSANSTATSQLSTDSTTSSATTAKKTYSTKKYNYTSEPTESAGYVNDLVSEDSQVSIVLPEVEENEISLPGAIGDVVDSRSSRVNAWLGVVSCALIATGIIIVLIVLFKGGKSKKATPVTRRRYKTKGSKYKISDKYYRDIHRK